MFSYQSSGSFLAQPGRFSNGNDDNGEKLCWICYCSDLEDKIPRKWIRPCRCCGSSMWVHQSCLQRWIDEKQANDPDLAVACRVCGYYYVIEYPPVDPLMVMLNVFDHVMDVSTTYVFGGALFGCLYWSAVTYGALTVMQVCGHDVGLAAMERTDPVILLLGLPAIPTSLIALRLVRWQDRVLHFWRSHAYRSPFFQSLLPKDIPPSRLEETREPTSLESIPRILCGALSLPTFSVFFGRLLFSRIQSRIGQTVAGGIFYVGFTGLVSIYHKEMKFLRKCRRRVVEYTPE
ncbi:unnamed protein product [Mesocestoides corti]|uniref:E3 ubiquitin-protein ligase MARCHF5 n=2 Tax=Mesocestoides corti TaxID=53468 RepID=A0A158QT48_MESCO|nr:unnamed protein product [Mesocestoides corti]